MSLSQATINAATMLKRHYPYRIVWAAIDPEGNELQGADTTRRQINKMLRLGYQVFELTSRPERRA